MKTPAVRERLQNAIKFSSSETASTLEGPKITANEQPTILDRPSRAALPKDPKLRQLFRTLVRKTNTPQASEQLLSEIFEHATRSPQQRQEVKAMLTFILSNEGLANPHTRTHINEHLERLPLK